MTHDDVFLTCSEILDEYDSVGCTETIRKLFNLYKSLSDDQVDEITHLQYIILELTETLVNQ